jgi:hypothetical protein
MPALQRIQNDEEHLSELEPLVKQLESSMPDEKLDARAVARIQMGILQYMEANLGPNVRPPIHIVRAPTAQPDVKHLKLNGRVTCRMRAICRVACRAPAIAGDWREIFVSERAPALACRRRRLRDSPRSPSRS